MAKLKTQKAATQTRLPKVIHADYVVHGAQKAAKDRTDFDGPRPTRSGAAAVLVADESQVAGVLSKVVGVKKGESLEVKGMRVLVENVHVAG